MKIRAVIITKSKMKKETSSGVFKGFCVTALDLDQNRLYRFPSDKTGMPMHPSIAEKIFPLSVIEAEIGDSWPLGPQTENVELIDNSIKNLGIFPGGIEEIYKRYSKIKHDDVSILQIIETCQPDVEDIHHSLEIVKVHNLKLYTNAFGSTKCDFLYNRFSHQCFSVTDPIYFLNKGQSQTINRAFLVISIPTDSFKKNGKEYGYYKFVAAIYPIP